MSWKANTAGLVTFIASITFVMTIYGPHTNQEAIQLEREKLAEEKEAARVETVDDIIKLMKNKYNLKISEAEAMKLNCKPAQRNSISSCFHNASLLPVTYQYETVQIPREYGSLVKGSTTFTLKSAGVQTSFTIESH